MKEAEVYIRDRFPPSWDESMTLEQWIRSMVEQGKEAEILPIIKLLPEARKAEYRRIWKEIKNNK